MPRPLRFFLSLVLTLFILSCGSSDTTSSDTSSISSDKVVLKFPDEGAILRSSDMLLDWDATQTKNETVWLVNVKEVNGETKTEVVNLKVDVTFYRPQGLEDNRTYVWKVEALGTDGDAVASSGERMFRTYPTRMVPFTGSLDRSGLPLNFTVVGDHVYFTALTPVHGREIWKRHVDGGEPTRVTDVIEGNASASPGDLTAFDGKLYFTAYTNENGRELWRVDESVANMKAKLVYDFTHDGSATGDEVELQKESGDPSQLVVVGGALYMAARTKETCENDPGCEEKKKILWRLADHASQPIRIDLTDSGKKGTFPEGITGLGTALYLTALTDDKDRNLWKVANPGTPSTQATSLVKSDSDLFLDVTPMVSFEGGLYFGGRTATKGAELWSLNASGDVSLVKDLAAGDASSWPAEPTVFDEKLFFAATTSGHGAELWESDGTADGTKLFYETIEGGAGGGPRHLTASTNRLFFVAGGPQPDDGLELWGSDGTQGGTLRLKDIRSGTDSSLPYSLTAFGERLLFAANDGEHGAELWESKGDANNTVLLKDIYPEEESSLADGFTKVGDKALFRANDGLHGTELWETNGTESGTAMVENINPYVDPNMHHVTRIGSTIVMVAETAAFGEELFTLDSTSGVSLVGDINPGYRDSSPSHLFVHNGYGYFAAKRLNSDTEKVEMGLWRTSGTGSGTSLVRMIHSDVSGSDELGPFQFTSFSGKFYFLAKTGVTPSPPSWELWESTGNLSNTKKVDFTATGFADAAADQSLASTSKALYWATETQLFEKEAEKEPVTISNVDNPRGLFAVGDGLLLSADVSGQRVLTLLKADGSVEFFNDVRNPSGYFRTGDEIYFKADKAGGGTALLHRFKSSDASVTHINTSQGSPLASVSGFCGTDGELWCLSEEKTENGRIWKVAKGESVAKDLATLGVEGDLGTSPESLVHIGETIYYAAKASDATVKTLFAVLKTSAIQVRDMRRTGEDKGKPLTNASQLTPVDGILYFQADSLLETGNKKTIWVTSPPTY